MQFQNDNRADKKIAPAISLLWMLMASAWAAQPNSGAISLTTVPAASKQFAVAVGQRLQKPGKERITASGTLLAISNGKSQTSQVAVTWQIPLQLRIDGAGPTIVANEGSSAAPGQAAKDNADTVETLLDDTVEGLVSINGFSGGTRFLGKGFRQSGGAANAPTYDVVQLFYPSPLRNGAQTVKTYWFDSKTKLLARVTYKSAAGAAVEVTLGNWQTVQGETFPYLIERTENGLVTMRLTVSAATVAPGAQDGKFGGN